MSSFGYKDLLSSRQNSLYELSFLPALNPHLLPAVFQVVATPKHGKTRKKRVLCHDVCYTIFKKSTPSNWLGGKYKIHNITAFIFLKCYRFSLASSRIHVLILNCIQRLVYPAILERNTKRDKLHTVQCNIDLHWRKEFCVILW